MLAALCGFMNTTRIKYIGSPKRAIARGIAFTIIIVILVMALIQRGLQPYWVILPIIVFILVSARKYRYFGYLQNCGHCNAELVEVIESFKASKQKFNYCPSCGAQIDYSEAT